MTAPVVTPLPRLSDGGTVVCLATGPSLTRADIEQCLGKAVIIAVNDAHRIAPEADILYAADARWWKWHADAKDFPGLKVSIRLENTKHPDYVQLLDRTGEAGLELQPTGLRHGRNSGYQAINLAVHLGAKRIVLLGYDLQRGEHGEHHFFGEDRTKKAPPLSMFVPFFQTLVKPLREQGIEIVNCSRRTALTCFPRMALENALQAREVAA